MKTELTRRFYWGKRRESGKGTEKEKDWSVGRDRQKLIWLFRREAGKGEWEWVEIVF